jgi:hypothetical protein
LKVGFVRNELINAGQGLGPEPLVEKFADMLPSRGLGNGLVGTTDVALFVDTAILTVVVAAGAVDIESSRSSKPRRLSSS